MIYVRRLLWLTAWSVWIWLGVGLYHQLPRALGPRLCNLPVDGANWPMGFVGAHDIIASHTSDGPEGRDLAVWDARNGHVIGYRRRPIGFRGGLDGGSPQRALDASLRYGFLLGDVNSDENRPVKFPGSTPEGLYALDVINDECRQLSNRQVSNAVAHSEKPWVAIVDGPIGVGADRVIVVDFTTGRTIFRTPPDPKRSIRGAPLFIVDEDLVALPTYDRFEFKASRDLIEFQIWKLADPPVLVAMREIAVWSAFRETSMSRNGRALFAGRFGSRPSETNWVDVYDFKTNEFLSTAPDTERPSPQGKSSATPPRMTKLEFSASGRSALKYGAAVTKTVGTAKTTSLVPSGGLHEVGSGRTLWETSPHERILGSTSDEVSIVERWQELWKDWFPNFKYESQAWRSLETGDVVRRVRAGSLILPRNINAARSLVMLEDGSVHPWPPQVDWKILAFCQAVLAVPLVLLWAILRWCHRRAERLQPAVMNAVQP